MRRRTFTKCTIGIGLAAVLATAGIIAGGAIALAHGGDTTQVHSCVTEGSGSVRIVGPDASCRARETALDWAIQGPTGPQGPIGATGAAGPAGPEGPAGQGIASFDELAGLPCRVGEPDEGVTVLNFDPDTREMAFVCQATTLWDLTVHVAGAAGSITSSPGTIDCSDDCSDTYINGQVVTLEPHEVTVTSAGGTGSTLFTGWSGACSGTDPCTVTMDAAKDVTATFVPAFLLQVQLDAQGRYIYTEYGGTKHYDLSGSYGSAIIDNVGQCAIPPGPNDTTVSSNYKMCTWKLPSPTYLSIGAQGSSYTPNVGWGFDCAAATNDCELGSRSANTAVYTSFQPD